MKKQINPHVFVRVSPQKYVNISHLDIMYLKADRAYCDIVTDNKTYQVTSSLNMIHRQLNSQDFIRVNRSFVVNLKRVTEVEGNMIKFGVAIITIHRRGQKYKGALLSSYQIIK